MRTSDFADFILAREALRVRKESNGTRPEPKPWTSDVILQNYRFCNVRREDDKVTKWIATNWRSPLDNRPELWFWMLVARLVNHPDTLAFIQYRMALGRRGWKWDEAKFIAAMQERAAEGAKTWGGAYIVSTNGHRMNKAEYIAKFVLTPAWQLCGAVRPVRGTQLSDLCAQLLKLNGVQGFIAGQVIADAKYADNFLKLADDWHTFAISGPGSRRGLNRVFGEDKDSSWKESAWHVGLTALRDETNRIVRPIIGELHAQDIQNCLCEFDKYERVRLGEGRPRSTYPGTK